MFISMNVFHMFVNPRIDLLGLAKIESESDLLDYKLREKIVEREEGLLHKHENQPRKYVT